MNSASHSQPPDTLLIGWASSDITPTMPVQLAGQFYVRVAEGVLDPLTVTALALSSGTADVDHAIVFVSCDLVSIPDSINAAVRERVSSMEPSLDPKCVVLNATHTHTAPDVRLEQDYARLGGGISSCDMDLKLPGDDKRAYVAFLVERIAEAVVAAWRGRRPGTVGFGLGQAVVGRNRRVAYTDGSSKMYGSTTVAGFAHVEGYEDHSVNFLGTWDSSGTLTGVVVNVACPSQVREHLFQVSADYWHDTRVELRKRLGEGLFILPQCSAAGDQAPRALWGKAAEERMRTLSGRTLRQEIAVRISDAVTAVLPHMGQDRRDRLEFRHHVETIELSRRKLSESDVTEAMDEAAGLRERYQTLLREIQQHPERKEQPRWYCDVTAAFRRMKWCEGVRTRWESEQVQARLPFEVHVLRLGDVALATNPFEYYLDFGIRIKARSPAVQTFLVQLAGAGTYVPSDRAVAGRSYGAVPASTPVGPEGGSELAEWTIAILRTLWAEGKGTRQRDMIENSSAVFRDLPIVDAHVHFENLALLAETREVLRANGIERLCIVSPARLDRVNVNPQALCFKAAYPATTWIFGGPDYSAIQAGSAVARKVLGEQARALRRIGFDGVKLLESKPTVARHIPFGMDDPVYADFFAVLEEEGLPVIWHVADPEEFWEPRHVSAEARHRGWDYTAEGFPAKETLYAQTECVLRRHPALRVILAHFYFMSADLDRAGRLLDAHPNVHFDITPGSEMFLNFAKAPDRTREFFLRYQDRIVFGTDTSAGASGLDRLGIEAKLTFMRRFLETRDRFPFPHADANFLHQAGETQGVDLPPSVLCKIYAETFTRLAGPPRTLDREAAAAECRRIAGLLETQYGFAPADNPARAAERRLSAPE